MVAIGCNTSSLYRQGVPFDKIVELFYSLDATAIEINMGSVENFLKLKLSKKTIDIIKKFNYISVHAPKLINKEVIKKLKFLCDNLPIKGIVVHPDVVEDFDELEKLNLPILLENMDVFKKVGGTPEEFKEWKKKYKFGFVLDLKHVYEHDPTMELTKKFIKVMGNRLKHLHVSGSTKKWKHFPVYLSDNKKAIDKILKLNPKVPKIIEGVIIGDAKQIIKNEIKHIKSFERD